MGTSDQLSAGGHHWGQLGAPPRGWGARERQAPKSENSPREEAYFKSEETAENKKKDREKKKKKNRRQKERGFKLPRESPSAIRILNNKRG